MIRMSCAAALVAFALGTFPARADEPPSLSVTGEATLSVAPDRADVDAGVSTEAKTAQDAAAANARAMNAVLAALKASGIADKDIQTSRLSLQPQYAQNRPNAPQVSGYRASNRITVTVRDITKAAATLDTLVSAGANEIGGISFAVSNASKLLDEVRGAAIADAKRKADIYAQAANITLGGPISIREDGAPGPMPLRKASFAAAPQSTPVAIGEETLRVQVSVSYAIKPAQ